MNKQILDDEIGTPLDEEISPMMQEVLNTGKTCTDECSCKNHETDNSVTIIEPEIIEATQVQAVEAEVVEIKEHSCDCGCDHDHPVVEDSKNKLNASNWLQNKKKKSRLKRKMQKESKKKNRKK